MSLSASGQFDADAALPPGMHPLDQTVGGDSLATPPDTPGDRYDTSRGPWSTENQSAVPVFQRLAHDWVGGYLKVSSNQNPQTVVGRQPGRGPVTIWVPNQLPDGTVPSFGVTIGSDQADIYNNGGIALGVGDSITIPSEASVYAVVTGSNATGACQWFATLNPAGGGLGAQ
jgi:hypothetical protein